jgi:hypothetical protein
MSSSEKPRRVIVGRRVFEEGSESHKKYMESQKKPEKLKSVEPEKTNRSGSIKDSGKPE